MGKVRRLGNTTNPLIVVEWIIAIQSVIGGLYLFSPYLHIEKLIVHSSPIVHTVTSDVGIFIFGSIVLLTALLLIAGICKRKVAWRSAALFTSGLTRLYALLAGILANGFLPLTWLSSATLMFLCFYIWGRIRKRGTE